MTIHRDGDTLSVSAVSAKWDPNRRIDRLGTVNFRALAENVAVEHLFGLAIDRMRAELGPADMFERIEEARDDARLALGLSRPRRSRGSTGPSSRKWSTSGRARRSTA